MQQIANLLRNKNCLKSYEANSISFDENICLTLIVYDKRRLIKRLQMFSEFYV